MILCLVVLQAMQYVRGLALKDCIAMKLYGCFATSALKNCDVLPHFVTGAQIVVVATCMYTYYAEAVYQGRR